MNVIESPMHTLEELWSLLRMGWDVRIKRHLPEQVLMGFGSDLLFDLQSLGLLVFNFLCESYGPGAKSELTTGTSRFRSMSVVSLGWLYCEEP